MLKDFNELTNMVKASSEKKRLVLACAHDEHSLDAVYEAYKDGIILPVLVGREDEIRELIDKFGFDFEATEEIYDIEDDVECAQKAVKLIREGRGDFLMKGRMQTADLLKQVVNKETGLQVGKIMSHVGLFSIPNYHKLVVMSDGGMLVEPDLEKKLNIINNAVETMHNMDYDNPKVAVLCAAEKINEKAIESTDAAALKEMNTRGEIQGCIIEGPISYDIALSKEIADLKGFKSSVSGDADILIVPNMATGNILGKSWTITAGGVMAGIIVGAKVPIVLTSRGASAEEKFYSIAFAAAATK